MRKSKSRKRGIQSYLCELCRPVSGLPGQASPSFLCYWPAIGALVLKLQLGSVAHSPLLLPPPGMNSLGNPA